jgi:hypothetical protein
MGFWKKHFGKDGGALPQLGEVAKIMTVPQLAQALDNLTGAGFDSAQVLRGLGVECLNCGPYAKDAKSLLVICALRGLRGGQKSNFFADPNMAAAAKAFEGGGCPNCGTQKFSVTFTGNRLP